MRIGFACLAIGVPGTAIRHVLKRSADHQTLSDAIRQNIKALDTMIEYCIDQSISLFRISSDIIPFGSSPLNTVDWQKDFADELTRIGSKIREAGIRVTMHPGQYTVLNAVDQAVVRRAVDDLVYHTAFLDSLQTNADSKIILHVGGAYGDKNLALDRFAEQYIRLPGSVCKRLVIENDERLFNVSDLLSLHQKIRVPVVFDTLHHALNHPDTENPLRWLLECRKTWSESDGPQKIHYSQQAVDKRPGSHTQTIQLNTFLDDIRSWPDKLDVMLEVKDKNLSAVKCMNAVRPDRTILHLEKEWARYKYEVLEQAPDVYVLIRQLLQDKKSYPVQSFYQAIENAADREVTTGHAVNAAQHVWGYLKVHASEREKRQFENQLKRYQEGRLSNESLKRFLCRVASSQNQPYLDQSLYMRRYC